MRDDDGLPERFSAEEPDEIFFQAQSHQSKNLFPLRTKILFWSVLAGSIAIGTFLFLFFITAFLYLFLPLFLILSLWSFLRRLKK